MLAREQILAVPKTREVKTVSHDAAPAVLGIRIDVENGFVTRSLARVNNFFPAFSLLECYLFCKQSRRYYQRDRVPGDNRTFRPGWLIRHKIVIAQFQGSQATRR